MKRWLLTTTVADKAIDVGIVLALVGYIWGVLACGLLAQNELNARILMGFGVAFVFGLVLIGIGFTMKHHKSW